MLPNLTPDIDLADELFTGLRAGSTDGEGVTREAYGPGERMAHALVRAAAEKIGLECSTDVAGNMYMTLPGTDRAAKRIIIGSHLDSVRQGGNYDGAAGVLAGMAAVAGMKRAGFVPGRDITVMAIRAEEAGAWFPVSYPGSRMALGLFKADGLAIPRNDSGRSLADHMREEGFDPDAVARGDHALGPHNVAGFLELHIEQGPVLEAEQVPIAIVTGIPGSRRLRQGRVIGEYNHSGATPRKYRRDAAAALAELVHRMDEEWCRLDAVGQVLVCTFCTMATTADAGFTKIAGEATFQLDVRSVSPHACDLMFEALHRFMAGIEARHGVRFECGPETGSRAAIMDEGIRDGLARAADGLGIAHIAMSSGAGHDAASFAEAKIPSSMLFVRNQNGSHNPHEAMRMEDFAKACAVVQRWAAEASL
jgi:N-carbamoyl-L-amino-acid hydrolase